MRIKTKAKGDKANSGMTSKIDKIKKKMYGAHEGTTCVY